jgi:hypothetical protein
MLKRTREGALCALLTLAAGLLVAQGRDISMYFRSSHQYMYMWSTDNAG